MAVVEQVVARPTARPAAAPAPVALPHLRGLDGVRALAVVAVLLYHLGVPWVRGGFLGVDVFFVLSGYLMATLVLDEVEATGRFRTGRYLARRVRRLVPALLVVLAAASGAALLVARDALASLRGDLLAALTYTSNWWQVVADRSYFELAGRPPLLGHLWTLAVEAQFYLLVPLVALLALRARRTHVGLLAAGLAVASAVAMGVLATRAGMPVPHDPTRVYVGTDTHATGLLLGVAAATVWQPWRTWRRPGSWATERGDPVRRFEAGVTDVLGVAALAGVVACVLLVDPYSAGLYRGGFAAFAALAIVLVGAAADPAGLLGRALARQPLRWLGERSYGIYLWHWPVLQLMRPDQDVTLPEWASPVVRAGVTLLLAEASYRWVETPVRRGALRRLVARLRTPAPGRASLVVRTAAVTACLATGVALLGTAVVRTPADSPQVTAAPPGPEVTAPAGPDAIGSVVPQQDRTTAATPTATPTPVDEVGTVVAVGDSVMLGAAAELGAHGVATDAVVSRQFAEMADLVLQAAAAGTLGHTVVVHGGTNGPVAEEDLRRLLAGTVDRRVFVVNVRVPRPWEQFDNELFARVVPEYPHARLLDWKSVAEANLPWFYDDGIHLREGGGREGYAAWIVHEIQPRR
ncbi:acyltransferase 3 [Cellulomonas flavigena DSM 20109]|uniref:Acyltransferase 3 n=1 Tax=Cellulomonas flavigena (strain ATCC 482 / DSM 20109 / BCRC 11376 / JCM 18109 / NBRC 3775 / NCIMB 8073 / NRS 134) TaxID=446466 RepID=D5UCG9_CELFN|nr:acyltransferase family protein [Cellulomonas flavigena]ADG74283.1 acyltransferase 3 [Cellulomonas flavigena DSM 20109]